VSNVNATTFTIVVVLFLVVTGAGFAAARWRRPADMMHLDEWGLGGRGFGTFITWFLLGGDLYTAYTFIAVPALVFGSGSIGFYAVAYTILVFPIVLIFLPRLWSVSRVHGYITPADFIRGRYGSRGLALASAFTGWRCPTCSSTCSRAGSPGSRSPASSSARSSRRPLCRSPPRTCSPGTSSPSFSSRTPPPRCRRGCPSGRR
jgi:Na+(H+)/acetate symporter ActP